MSHRCIGGTGSVTENAEARKPLLLALVLGDIDQGAWAGSFGLGGAEHLLVGLELKLKGTVAIGQ